MIKNRLYGVGLALFILLNGISVSADPTNDARTALGNKEYAKVDTILEKTLDRLNPPETALRLSLMANIAQGNFVTANRRVETLLRVTENRNLKFVYMGGKLAELIGDSVAEQERLRYFALNQPTKNDDLDDAFSRLLGTGIYPDVYRRYIKLYGPTDQGWKFGVDLLNRLIQAYDGAQTREQAGFLMDTFTTPERINHVVERLRYAADNFVLGKDSERYQQALQTIVGHPFTDQSQIHHMVSQVPDRLDMVLQLQKSCPNPFDYQLFDNFNPMHDVKEEAVRVAMGKKFLEFESVHQKSENRYYYLRYVRFIADRPQVFRQGDQPLVSAADAQRMFDALFKKYPDNPEALHDLSARLLEVYITDGAQRTAFIRKYAPAIRPDRLAWGMGENHANASEIVKLTGNNLWARHYYLAVLKDPAMKADILDTVRDWVMAYPAKFDGADLGRKLRDNPVPTIPEKIAVLRELYQKIGFTEQMRRLMDELDNNKEIADSEPFKAFKKEFDEKKPGNDALALAQINFWGKQFQPHDPQLHAAVQEAFKFYGGKYPVGKDWKRDKIMGDILNRYADIVWHNKDTVFTWADKVAPHLGQTDYWDRLIRRVCEHGGINRIESVSKHYLEAVDGGWEGRPIVWQELRQVHQKEKADTTFLSNYYKQMGSDNACDFLNRNSDRLSQQDFIAEIEKILRAYPLADWPEHWAKEMLNQVWKRTFNQPDAKAAPTRLVADAFWEHYTEERNGNWEQQERAFQILAKLDGTNAAIEKLLAYAATKPPATRASLASNLVPYVFNLRDALYMPREENGSDLKPGHRGHFLIMLLRPIYNAVPAQDANGFWFHEWMFGELEHFAQHGSENAKKLAEETRHEMAIDLANGARYWGNEGASMRLLTGLTRRAIEQADWQLATRATRNLADRFDERWNWAYTRDHFIYPLTTLMTQKEAWELLYVFTSITLKHNPEKSLEASLINIKAEAAQHIPGLYPVSPDNPIFDLFKAADEYLSGNSGKAWELTRPKLKSLDEHWVKFDKSYMAWVVEQMRLQKMFEPCQTLCMTMLLKEEQISPDAAGAILLTRADVYRDMKNFEAAKTEYEALKDNKRYAMTEAGRQAGFRLVDLLIRTGAYDSAEMILERWRTHSQPEMRAQSHYFTALIAFERQEYDTAREELQNVFDIKFDHTDGRLLQGEIKAITGKGVGDPEIPIGIKGERDYIVPGRQLTVSVTDKNLAIVRQGQSIPVVVRTSTGKDLEKISLYPSSGSPHKFKASIATALGDAVPGDMKLQVMGSDMIRYEIDPQFIKDNDLDPFPPKTLSVIDDARLAASAGRILTEKEQQELALESQIFRTSAEIKRDYGRLGKIVRPGNHIYAQVIDGDRDVSPEKDSVFVNVTTSSGDAVERFELIETEPHSGIFRNRLETTIPPPRATASDSAQGIDPGTLINRTKKGLWQSNTSDTPAGKWVEVDTMSSHDIKQIALALPDPAAVNAVRLEGMLTGDLAVLGSFPASQIAAKGGVMQQDVVDRGNETHPRDMRNIAIRIGAETGPVDTPVFDRENSPYKGRNGWMVSRVRGNFHLDESKTYEFKFIHKPSPDNWQYAYLMIDGKQILGGLINGDSIKTTRTVILSSGLHQFELLVRDYWDKSRVEVGFRQDDGTYKSLPNSWFSTAENPKLAEALREKATIKKTDKGFIATLEKPQRLRRIRWVFTDFSGNSIQARKMAVINADGQTIIPCEVDFSSATTNRILEIAPGDSIDLVYEDEVRTTQENAVLSSTLGAEFYNGTIRIANETLTNTPQGMIPTYNDAMRFRPGDQLTILVWEADKDISANADTVEVKVTTGRGETLVLKALEKQERHRADAPSVHTGVFYTILRTGNATQGNTIKVVPGDSIEVSYMDEENTVPGIPIKRSARVVEAGSSTPETLIFRTAVNQVEDTGKTALRQLERMKLRGKNVNELKIYKDQLVATAPDKHLEHDTPDSAKPVKASMNMPLLFQVFYPSMAMHRGSETIATIVTDNELRAAREEGRDPRGTDVTMTIQRLADAAAGKGYDVRIESSERYTDERLMTKGVFSGVCRLQLGGPNDPIDDIVRTDDLATATNGNIKRVDTLLVTKPEKLYVLIRDRDGKIVSETPIELASTGHLALLDNTYTATKTAIHVGESFYLRLTDPDRNSSPQQDELKINLKSEKTGAEHELVLTETMPYSGIFTASLKPYLKQQIEQARQAAAAPAPANPATPEDDEEQSEPIPENPFLIDFGDTVTFTYSDPITLSGTPENIQAQGSIHLGADGKLAVFSKKFKDPEMAVKVRFLRAESLFEMAKDYRKLKETEKSENLIAEGRRILTEALRDYPNTKLVSQGQYLLANLSQELAEDETDVEKQRKLYQEAIGKYSNILSTWSDSDYAPQAQFKLAICFEKLENYDQATEEYVKLTYTYPEHKLVSDATVRLGNHYYKTQRYGIAGEIFFNFQQRFQDHPLASKALFLAAQCHMKKAEILEQKGRQAAEKADELREAIKLLTLLLDTYKDDNDLCAEAMYWIGDNHFKISDFRQSYIVFKKLTFDYPASEWAKRARGYLTDQKFTNIEE